MAQQAGHQPDASSSDPLAGIITQVSPTGHQPGRAPARPTKPRTQSKPKQKASKTANVNKPEPSVPQQQQQQQQEPADQAVSGPQPADQQPSRVYDQQQQQRNNTVQGASQNSSVEDSSRQSHGQDASSTLVEAPVDAQEGQAAAARTQAPASRPHTSDSAATKEHAENRSKEQRPDSPQSKSGKKKGKGKKSSPSPWTAFLMALGCVSKDAYDDNDDDDDAQHGAGKPLKRRKSAEKQSQPPAPNHHATPSVPMTEITRPSNDSQQPYQGPSTTTQEQQQREMAPLGVAPAEPAAMSSAPPSTGIPLPPEETGNVMSGAVVPPGADGHHSHTPKKRRSRGSTRTTDSQLQLSSTADESGVTTSQPGAGDIAAEVPSESSDLAVDSEEEEEEEEESMLNEDEEEERIIQAGGMGIPVDEDGNPNPLLAPLIELDHGRKCLVLDLDETLVHSSFKQIQAADYIVPVEIENQVHNVFVIKRPGVDEFLRLMGEIYEVVVFTASLSKYADPVLDQLDIHQVVRHRLFRESCYNHKGNYVKDLSQLGRPINDCIIIDNSPASYIFHPKNAVPVSSWFNDPHDTELVDMIGVLADLAHVDDVRSVLDGFLDIQ